MYWTDDPVKDAERYIADQEKRAAELLPKCADCGEYVQEDYYFEINDEVICPDCLDSHYRKWVQI